MYIGFFPVGCFAVFFVSLSDIALFPFLCVACAWRDVSHELKEMKQLLSHAADDSQ